MRDIPEHTLGKVALMDNHWRLVLVQFSQDYILKDNVSDEKCLNPGKSQCQRHRFRRKMATGWVAWEHTRIDDFKGHLLGRIGQMLPDCRIV